MKDVRDDICHRTAYDKVRSATFPGLVGLIRAGQGVSPFLSGADLRTYLTGLFCRLLALACVAEEFVYERILAQHPGQPAVPPAMVVADGDVDLTTSSKEPLFPVGTVIMTLPRRELGVLPSVT